MINKETILTAEGLTKLETELEYLQFEKRLEVAERIKIAISYGDISENSEYDDAKNEQAFIEGRIVELQQMINTASVIDRAKLKKGTVALGSVVILRDLEEDTEETYTVVGTTEADPAENRISNESPVGIAILGQKVNAIVQAQTPAGELSYKIMKIE
jgi:transcription elongation factor GreA